MPKYAFGDGNGPGPGKQEEEKKAKGGLNNPQLQKQLDEDKKAALQQKIIDEAYGTAELYGQQVGQAEDWLADYLVTSEEATEAGMDVQRQEAARAMQASIGGRAQGASLTGAGAQRAESAAARAGTAEAAYITGRQEEVGKTKYDKSVDILNLEAQAADQRLKAHQIAFDAPSESELREIKEAKYDAAWARAKAESKSWYDDDEEAAFQTMLSEVQNEPDEALKDKYLRKMCAVIDSGDSGASICQDKGFEMDTHDY